MVNLYPLVILSFITSLAFGEEVKTPTDDTIKATPAASSAADDKPTSTGELPPTEQELPSPQQPLSPQGEAKAVSSIQSWLNKLGSNFGLESNYVHRVVFIKSVEGEKAVFWDLSREEFEEEGFLELVVQDEAEFIKKINIRPDGRSSYQKRFSSPEEYFTELLAITHADTFVLGGDEDKRWTLYNRDATGNIKRQFTVKALGDISAEGVREWIIEKVGYVAIVLASDSSKILAGTLKNLDIGSNVLFATESSGKMRVREEDEKSSTLLKVTECENGMCVLEIIGNRNEPLPKGTKLVL